MPGPTLLGFKKKYTNLVTLKASRISFDKSAVWRYDTVLEAPAEPTAKPDSSFSSELDLLERLEREVDRFRLLCGFLFFLFFFFFFFSDLCNSLSSSSSTVTTGLAFSSWVRPDDPAVPYSSYFLCVLDLLPVDFFDTIGLLATLTSLTS